MELAKEEKEYLRRLLQRELEHIRKDEATILEFTPKELATEENYETFLEKLIKKLK